MKPILWVWKLTGRRLRSNLPLSWLLYPHQFLSQATQLTSSSPLSTSAQKSMPPVVQNLKSAVGLGWPKPASVSSVQEYGAPAFLSLVKFNCTMYTFKKASTLYNEHGAIMWNSVEAHISYTGSHIRTELSVTMEPDDTDVDKHDDDGCN